jgi:hypothetical protein
VQDRAVVARAAARLRQALGGGTRSRHRGGATGLARHGLAAAAAKVRRGIGSHSVLRGSGRAGSAAAAARIVKTFNGFRFQVTA